MKFLLTLFLLFFTLVLSAGELEVPKGGDFILKTPEGVLKTEELRGKVLFIYFGFLHCPQVCPTTVRQLNRMVKSLNKEQKESTRIIFVTVDPERDTPEKLKTYFANFDPIFIPAYGTHEEVRKVMKLYGADFKLIKGKDPGDVFVDHNTNVFVLNPKGEWVNMLPYTAKAEEFKEAGFNSPMQPPFWSEAAQMQRLQDLGGNKDCDLSAKPCDYITAEGIKYTVEIKPRPVKHLSRNKIFVRVEKKNKLTPKMVDIVGQELPMGIIRPKLQKLSDNEWGGMFQLPSCALEKMNFSLRLLLEDTSMGHFEIKYHFKSFNPAPVAGSSL